MRLRTKLIVSFCIILFVPLLLAGFALWFFSAIQGIEIYWYPGMLESPDARLLRFEVGIFIASVMILTITAALLTLWIYKGLYDPLRRLQEALQNIKEGNLDFSLNANSRGEMGALIRSFEEMRIRLKESAEEKLVNERENKELISNISHDLKTPITAIKGYVEGIMDGVADTPEKMDRYLRTVYQKADEMNTLINELTLYAHFDTNQIPYAFNHIKASDFFADCIEELSLDLESQDIELNCTNYVEDDVQIIADPEQLKRVIRNIIGNSAKYLDKPDGFISMRIRDVKQFIQVEIEDNGKGIAAKDLPYVFDRFYRTDASRNSATGGSGIGLAISKKIIEDHGGEIWIRSKEHAGTTIYFSILKWRGAR